MTINKNEQTSLRAIAKQSNCVKNGLLRRYCLLAITSLLPLTACEMYAPSNLNETKIQVAEQGVQEDIGVSEMSNDRLVSIARDYGQNPSSSMSMIVTYDPNSYRNTAMMAGDRAAKYAKSLRRNGVKNVKTSILPVKDQGDEGRVLISYSATKALAPDGCGDMPGIKGNLIEPDPAYRLGCGVDTMIAKQVARPNELLGRDSDDPTSDGRPASNIIEGYRTGAQNKPLDGESASGTN